MFNVQGISNNPAPEKGSLIFPPPPSSTHPGPALHAAAGAPAACPAPKPPAPSSGGKKIGGGQWEATKELDVREPAGGVAWRPRRGQRSVPSPDTPARPLPRSRALYRARARRPPSSSSLRAVAGSARGGGAGRAPPGRGGALFASLSSFPPLHTPGHPQARPHCFPFPLVSSPGKLSVPPPLVTRYSSWLKPGLASLRAPPDLPACNSDHFRIQKHVDHTSVRLLRYRLLVQGTRGSKEGGRRAGRKPLEFSDFASAFRLWGTPPHLDFGVGKSPGVRSGVCSCLVGGEKGSREGGRAGGSRCRCLVSPAPIAATLPGTSRTGFAPPKLAAHGLRITCRNRARPGVGVGSSQRELDSFRACTGGGWGPDRNLQKGRRIRRLKFCSSPQLFLSIIHPVLAPLLLADGEIPGQPQSEHAGQEGGGDARDRRP